MTVHQAYTERLGFWVVVLLGVFAWAPAMYPGYWQALEGFLPVFNVTQSSPISSIATVPDLWRGTGSAAFLFAQPILLLGTPPVIAIRATFALCFVLGGLGVYAWLRPKLDDRPAGLAGLVYMLWPPFLATVYIRGSLDDAMLFALLPLALAGAATYAATRSITSAAVVTFSILLMWRSQAGLAVFATILLFCYCVLVERSFWTTTVVVVSGLAGLASLIPLWTVQSARRIDFFDHFVYPFQLLYGSWLVSPSIPGWQDEYPFQLGVAGLVFAVLAVWFWNREHPILDLHAVSRFLLFCVGGTLLVLLMILPISALAWQWTGAYMLLEHPWQLLVLIGPLLAAQAGLLPVACESLKRVPYWPALAILTVLGSFPYLTTEHTTTTPPAVPVGVFGADNQIILLDVQLDEEVVRESVDLHVVWQVVQSLDFDYNVFFQALATEGGESTVVSQLDTQPLQGLYPASTWQPGDIYTDTYRLKISSDETAVTQLRYHFGYYDWRTGERLPLNGGIDDKLEIYGQ